MAPTLGGAPGGSALTLLWLIFCLFFYQNLPDHPLNEVDADAFISSAAPVINTANPVDRVIRVCIIAISLFVIARRWSLGRPVAKTVNPGFLSMMLLAPLSALWSIDPAATLLRFSTFACIVLACFAISVTGWNSRRLQQFAIPPTMFILIASLIAGVLYPDRVVELGTDISQKGAWHGITFSKNTLGALACSGTILCAHGWLAREGRPIWSVVGAAAAFACLILSRSSTSLFAAVVGIAFMTLMCRVPLINRRYSTHLVVGIAGALFVYELVIQNVIPGVGVLLGPIAGLAGKDTTFSARTIIWSIIKEHIRASPILGTGYGAYWTGPFPSSPSYVFIWTMYFYPTESHNGYLEIANDLGMVGLLSLLAFLYWYVRQGLELMEFDRSQGILYLGLLFPEMVINMSESDWFNRGSTFTILILATTCMSRALFEHRRHRDPASVVATTRSLPPGAAAAPRRRPVR